jgi:hypothetical protein
MKRTLIITVFLVLIGSLYGQSVVELSRHEKARRDSLKSRAKVITNADLAAVKRVPAVFVPSPDTSTAATLTAGDNPETAGTPEPGAGIPSQGGVMVPTVAKDGPALFKDGESADRSASNADVASRLKAADELIDLLTTKMNALMQEANNLDTMTPKDAIQKQIDETNQKLIRVQEEAAKLKSQIDAGKKSPSEKR